MSDPPGAADAPGARGGTPGAAIAWNGVRKRFGQRVVLSGVDLAVASGSAAVLLGPNGAGKTTLIRIGASLARPTGGHVRIHGLPPAEDGRARVGYLGHETLLHGHLSALENLLFYGRLYGVEGARGKALALLDRAGIARRAGDPVARLSRGTQQRAAICRAFLHEPSVLLLDEPFTGLDPAGTALLAGWIRERVTGGAAALVSTHDLAAALGIADRLLVLADGRIVGERSAAGLSLAGLEAHYRDSLAAARAG